MSFADFSLEGAKLFRRRSSLNMLGKNGMPLFIDDVDETRKTNCLSFFVFELCKGFAGFRLDEPKSHAEDTDIDGSRTNQTKALLFLECPEAHQRTPLPASHTAVFQ